MPLSPSLGPDTTPPRWMRPGDTAFGIDIVRKNMEQAA
jgi:hypothetical protein